MNLKKGIINKCKKIITGMYTVEESKFARQASVMELSQGQAKELYDTNIPVKEADVVTSYKKDLYIERLLDSNLYTFKDCLYLQNPFWHAPLAGLLLFVTEVECMVQYTIQGRNGNKDYQVCDESIGKKHRVPIMGLYPDCVNKVEVSLLDKQRNVLETKILRIKTAKLMERLQDNIEVSQDNGNSYWDFMYVTGGRVGSYIMDDKGEIRHYFRKISQPYGAFVLDKGKVFFPERHFRRPNRGNCHSVVGHEMDLLGRVFKTYYHEQGYHHWGSCKQNDGNLLLASSSMSDGYMENYITELDRVTGKVLRSLNMNDLYDNTYITRYDWAHINAFEYIPEEDSLVICMRNIHTIAKIHMGKQKIEWMIANPEFYANTEQKDVVLKPVGDVEWFFQQHGVRIISNDGNGKLLILLFDNHVINRRPVDYFDKKKESYVTVYEVDEKEFTVKMKKRITLPLAITRSNGDYDMESQRIIGACANFVPKVDDFEGKLFEYDYETEQCVKEFSMKNNYFAAHTIEFNINELSKPMDQSVEELFVGNLYGPKQIEQLPNEINNAPEITLEVKKIVKFRIWGNVLQVYSGDHDLEKLYLYNEKEVYLQDYTDTVQTMEVFKNQSYHLSIPLDCLNDGRYQIAIQYIGQPYTTNYWIERRK